MLKYLTRTPLPLEGCFGLLAMLNSRLDPDHSTTDERNRISSFVTSRLLFFLAARNHPHKWPHEWPHEWLLVWVIFGVHLAVCAARISVSWCVITEQSLCDRRRANIISV